MENLRKVWYDQNDQPPKNYIWYKNGQYLEWNGSKWVSSKGLNESNQGASGVHTVNSLDELQNPQEGDIAIIPEHREELPQN